MNQLVMGIDPGANTGIALYTAGKLTLLVSIAPYQLARYIMGVKPSRIVFEDSRLQPKVWTTNHKTAVALNMARKVGQVDAWCSLITAICDEMQIPAHGISPKGKGAKLNAAQFAALTGWTGSSNEHTRDAAAVAFPYRRAQA